MPTLDDAQLNAWQLADPNVPFNENSAITKKWLSLKRDGRFIGVPVGPEMALQGGERAQVFTSGAVLVWRGGEQVDVV
jgi:hypothetical protein